MAQDLILTRCVVAEGDIGCEPGRAYDLGFWAAGFEERARWLISSRYLPSEVGEWLKVEFCEDRDVLDAPKNISIDFGRVLGGQPGRRSHDGHWASVLACEIRAMSERLGRPVRLFVDYSSMPRTLYGVLVLGCLLEGWPVSELTMAYVPGHHAGDIVGRATVEGLRTLVGADGRRVTSKPPAVIVGLGYDGTLAEAIVEFFQIGRYSCLLAAPGGYPDGEGRAVAANERLLRRAEMVLTAPARSCVNAISALRKLREWHSGRELVVVPLGPKPHVLASLVLASEDDSVGIRFVQAGTGGRPVQVVVLDGAQPHVSVFRFADAELR